MDIPFILSYLPPLVIIENVLIDDTNLFKNEELLELWGVLVLNLSCNVLNLLHKLIDLLQLDEKDLVADNTLDQVNELFSGQNVERD